MKRIAFTEEKLNKYIDERKKAPCFICDIVSKGPLRNKHHIIYEDKNAIAFLSAIPTQYGQTLVCPKKHVEQIVEDLNKKEYSALQNTVYDIALAVQEAVHPERLYIASFGSNQMNSHIHFHIVPLPKKTPLKKQQMAAMLAETVGYLMLNKKEWQILSEQIKSRLD